MEGKREEYFINASFACVCQKVNDLLVWDMLLRSQEHASYEIVINTFLGDGGVLSFCPLFYAY